VLPGQVYCNDRSVWCHGGMTTGSDTSLNIYLTRNYPELNPSLGGEKLLSSHLGYGIALPMTV
jgi:hypothetical protein